MAFTLRSSWSTRWPVLVLLLLTVLIDFSAGKQNQIFKAREAKLATDSGSFTVTSAVKHETFKTCDQSGFCKRNRAFADAAIASPSPSRYQLDTNTASFANGQFRATVVKTTAEGTRVELPLNVTFLKSGLARVTLDEEQRRTGSIELRHDSKARKERYNESLAWALVGGLDIDISAELASKGERGASIVRYGKKQDSYALIRHNPFNVEFGIDGKAQITFNHRGFLNVEHWRPKTENKSEVDETQKVMTEDESTWWEESFGGNTDTKPKGPESIAMDISFPGYKHVFGIPEHTGPLSLRQTRYGPHLVHIDVG